MTGDAMEAWKEDQLNVLMGRVNMGILETDEQLWDLFEADFRQAFTNTHKAQDAQCDLQSIRQKDNLDSYISEFKRVARDTGVPLNDIGTITLFKKGLKKGLLDNIIDSDVYNPLAAPWTFDRWAQEAVKQHGKWKEKNAFHESFHTGLYKMFGVKNQNQKWTTSQGGHHMDVDAVCTTNHSEEKKAELMKGNQCFYCEIKGHHAKDCCKKAADRAKQSSGSTAPRVTATLTPDELTKFIKDNMGNFEEDTKISIIEALMPKDFVQGPN
jgi:hypothetical protein